MTDRCRNPRSFVRSLTFLFLLGTIHPSHAQETALLSGAEWSHETVAEGVTLHRAAFRGDFFESNQYLCVLEVAPGARFDIVPSEDEKLEKTSSLAAKTGAIAAINGSFFNMRAPYGSVNYLRVDGEELAPNAYDSYENDRKGRSTRQTGAVATFKGNLYVLKSDALGRWERDIEAEDIVTTGPLLICGGVCEAVVKDNFNKNRHPRTAVGVRPDGTVLLLVADGRNSEAAGLSMLELQQVMVALGCRDAINLDGGGSTELVVKGNVVNSPSDGRERPIADALLIVEKAMRNS